MQRMKMAETIKDAVMYIEQGHVKVGINTVTDPAFHVSRNMEDHITWVRGSKIHKKVKDYRNERDDFEIFEWHWKFHDIVSYQHEINWTLINLMYFNDLID